MLKTPPLITYEINFILTWPEDYILIPGGIDNQVRTFVITDTKYYVSYVTFVDPRKRNTINQLKSGFKETINWNEYLNK